MSVQQQMASVEPSYYATHDLPMFHDAPPMHTHKKCSNCLSMQRAHGLCLRRCTGCKIELYCSTACQQAHWASHSRKCKKNADARSELAGSTQLETAWLDARQWMDHYDAVLWNAAIAAMQLASHPPRNLDHTEVLYVHIHHGGNIAPPVHKRFIVQYIKRCSAHSSSHLHENAVAISRHELPNNSYGAVGMCLKITYEHPSGGTPISTYLWKYWSVDTSTAAAARRDDWKALLHTYLTRHARIRFCCVNGPGNCCCGGWVHGSEARADYFAELERTSETTSM